MECDTYVYEIDSFHMWKWSGGKCRDASVLHPAILLCISPTKKGASVCEKQSDGNMAWFTDMMPSSCWSRREIPQEYWVPVHQDLVSILHRVVLRIRAWSNDDEMPTSNKNTSARCLTANFTLSDDIHPWNSCTSTYIHYAHIFGGVLAHTLCRVAHRSRWAGNSSWCHRHYSCMQINYKKLQRYEEAVDHLRACHAILASNYSHSMRSCT